jgi:hypothetical protein
MIEKTLQVRMRSSCSCAVSDYFDSICAETHVSGLRGRRPPGYGNNNVNLLLLLLPLCMTHLASQGVKFSQIESQGLGVVNVHVADMTIGW